MKWLTTFVFSVSIYLMWAAPSYAQEVFEETPGLFSTRQIGTAVPIGTQKKVTIQSASTLRGKINIATAEVSEVSVSYFKKSKADSKSRAIDFIDLIAVRLERIADGIRLQLSAPNPAPWTDLETGLVEAELTIPESCFVEIEAPYFDIEAHGPFEGVVVPSSLGKLEVTDVSKQLELKTANRRVSIEKISGDISVTTSNSELAAKDISSVDKQARFKNDGGDIRIGGFVGRVNVKNSYGRIEITDFEPQGSGNLIRGFSGPVIVDIKRITDGQVVINNRFEDIGITVPSDLSARLSLAVDKGGKIEAGNFTFKTDLVQPNRLNLVAGDGESLISGSIRGKGNIFVRTIEGEE